MTPTTPAPKQAEAFTFGMEKVPATCERSLTVARALRDASIARMRALSFGDPVTNVCAGENNPGLHAFFVAYEVKSHKNGYGLTHKSHWAKCTDKKGKFWNTDIDVVYPGHLDAATRSELFSPVWESLYGTKAAAIRAGGEQT
ncbi:hypothetical protein J2W30_002813 [Variovorax boronicumulans]|uniref:hypothetical protein n=1 Tax=Variovorax boronicumulans TaxID=436515 RepID=UPI0027872833|nr:hypothetical protein [Variovorax boronicumulans]MDQ0035048.1 hypothetical protein [Variovorax boronicumulans]